jgi:hypothetical protein
MDAVAAFADTAAMLPTATITATLRATRTDVIDGIRCPSAK